MVIGSTPAPAPQSADSDAAHLVRGSSGSRTCRAGARPTSSSRCGGQPDDARCRPARSTTRRRHRTGTRCSRAPSADSRISTEHRAAVRKDDGRGLLEQLSPGTCAPPPLRRSARTGRHRPSALAKTAAYCGDIAQRQEQLAGGQLGRPRGCRSRPSTAPRPRGWRSPARSGRRRPTGAR